MSVYLFFRTAQPSSDECGLLHLPLPLLWAGVLPHVPGAPEVPIHQVRDYTLRCCLAQHCTVTLLKWLFELPLVATVSDRWNTYGMPFLSCLAYLQKLCVY